MTKEVRNILLNLLKEELTGLDLTFCELDNIMTNHDIQSEAESVDWDEIAESGVILYQADDEGMSHFRVEFVLVSMHEADETADETIIKVKSVELQ